MQRVIRDTDPSQSTAVWNELENNARTQLKRDGFQDDRMRFNRSANLHYKGKIFELTVPVPDGDFDSKKLQHLKKFLAKSMNVLMAIERDRKNP